MIAFWAHVGGFATGLVMVFLFRQPEREEPEWWDGRRKVRRSEVEVNSGAPA